MRILFIILLLFLCCDDNPVIPTDECGVPNGDNSTCLGCDGIPNSGLVNDGCGECGGNGYISLNDSECTINSFYPEQFWCEDINVLEDLLEIINNTNSSDINYCNDLYFEFNDSGMLEYIELSNLNIPYLPDNIGELSELNSLILNSNTLTTIPTSIVNLSELVERCQRMTQDSSIGDSLDDCVDEL